MDPYVILTCRTQEHRSGVASGKGSEPEWNETFVFNVNEGASELHLKIMDKDRFSADDFVGEATIPLDAVFEAGTISTTACNVVKDEEYCGEIRVSLTFTPQEDRRERGYEGEEESYERGYGGEEESFGGWKQSEIGAFGQDHEICFVYLDFCTF